MAIQIQLQKAPKDYDLGVSKFFGTPTIPLEWEEDFDRDVLFFCQIRLRDIAELDVENNLPHNGYLYVFLHTAKGNGPMTVDLRYYNGTPTLALEEFNGVVEGYEHFTTAYPMTFSPCDDREICTRLFGVPSDWNYEEPPPNLLMQFDPLDNPTGFLDSMDGFLYLFSEKTGEEFSAKCHLEYS